MQLDWINSFLAVVEYGSFSAAADALRRSQPRISAHIAALERCVEARLFDRDCRPVALTDAGRTLVPHARQVIFEIDAARADVAAVTGGQRGDVRLGSYPSASAAFLPVVLERLGAEYPGIRVRLLEMGSVDLETFLAQRDVDLMLRPLDPPMHTLMTVSRTLWSEDAVAVLPDGHDLAAVPDPLKISDVVAHPIITTGRAQDAVIGGASMPEMYLRLRRSGHVADVAFETTQPQTMVSLVRHGHGVGVVNMLAATSSDIHGLVIRRIEGLESARTVAVHWLERGLRSVAAQILLDTILTTPVPADAIPAHDAGGS